MEACAGAHRWARELQSHGYTVRLIPPQFVKPYVKSKKNDANDAELMMQRKAKANQIRGLVVEYGLVAPLTLRALSSTIPCWLEDAENGLTDYFRSLLNGLWSDLVLLDHRVLEMDREIERLANSNEVTRRLQQPKRRTRRSSRWCPCSDQE